MTYEDLLKEADSFGLIVKEKPLKAYNGRIKGNRIAIKKDLKNDIAKKCTLVEELGHHHTTVGNILDQSDIRNRKQERSARTWGYEKLIDVSELIKAKKEGIRNRYELAEYLSIDEQFLEESLKYFKEKYGNKCIIDKYIIQFEPLEVFENVYETINLK